MQTDDHIVFGSPSPGISYTFRPAAYAVFVSEKGEIAVVEGRHGYFLPGGGTDEGETPEETVIREVREELGCEIELKEKIGTVTQYFIAQEGPYRMSATFFACSLAGEPSGEGEYELQWVLPHNAEKSFYHQCHVWAIRQVID